MNLLSLPEAAKRIGCSASHVRNLVYEKKLTRYNIAIKGQKIRVSDEDVDRYIEECRQPDTDASDAVA